MRLRNIQKNDRKLLQKWLETENIFRWFGDPEYWLEELFYAPKTSFIGLHNDKPVGFCRYTATIPEEYLKNIKILGKTFWDDIYAFEKSKQESKKLSTPSQTERLHLSSSPPRGIISVGIPKVSSLYTQNLQKDDTSIYHEHQLKFQHQIEKLHICCIDYAIAEEKYRSQGFGKKILSLLLEEICNQKTCLIFASSSLKNTDSSRLLQKHGFIYYEKLKVFILLCS